MSVETFPRQFDFNAEPPLDVGPRGSDRTTEGIRVQVAPRHLPEHSRPQNGAFESDEDDSGELPVGPRWVWSYRVRISNVGERTATLVDRHWVITDGDGYANEVRGPGVVGHQPTLAPGQAFEYESFCPLETPWGTMEGSYRFRMGDPAPKDSSGGDRAASESEPDDAGGDANHGGGQTCIIEIGRFFLTQD